MFGVKTQPLTWAHVASWASLGMQLEHSRWGLALKGRKTDIMGADVGRVTDRCGMGEAWGAVGAQRACLSNLVGWGPFSFLEEPS